MLLSLPLELIEHIIRLSLPSETTSSTYRERQGALRDHCLVNSLLRLIAQPILDEVVYVVLSDLGSKVWRGLLKGRLLPHLAALQTLGLDHLWSVDLAALEHLPNLRSLAMWDISLKEVNFRLQHVQELTSLNVEHDRLENLLFPTTSTFPSLRALAYSNDNGRAPPLEPTLLQHLITLSLPVYDRFDEDTPCTILRDISGQTFVKRRRFKKLAESYKFARVWTEGGDLAWIRGADLRDLSDILVQLGSAKRLSRLYLPDCLSPEGNVRRRPVEELEELRATCEAYV